MGKGKHLSSGYALALGVMFLMCLPMGALAQSGTGVLSKPIPMGRELAELQAKKFGIGTRHDAHWTHLRVDPIQGKPPTGEICVDQDAGRCMQTAEATIAPVSVFAFPEDRALVAQFEIPGYMNAREIVAIFDANNLAAPRCQIDPKYSSRAAYGNSRVEIARSRNAGYFVFSMSEGEGPGNIQIFIVAHLTEKCAFLELVKKEGRMECDELPQGGWARCKGTAIEYQLQGGGRLILNWMAVGPDPGTRKRTKTETIDLEALVSAPSKR